GFVLLLPQPIFSVRSGEDLLALSSRAYSLNSSFALVSVFTLINSPFCFFIKLGLCASWQRSQVPAKSWLYAASGILIGNEGSHVTAVVVIVSEFVFATSYLYLARKGN
ncbi:hypothetical protein MUO74_10175, partial [Candidatus Bathyarchaeota archaeon]|nr:hypothetical protein [Candidatus Bathyarchaeota archaeon]